MVPPVKRSKVTLFRAFLAADTGGTGLGFTLVAGVVGLMMAIPLYLAGNMISEKFEMIAAALRHQNYQ